MMKRAGNQKLDEQINIIIFVRWELQTSQCNLSLFDLYILSLGITNVARAN